MAQDQPLPPSKKRKEAPTAKSSTPNKRPKTFQRPNFANKRRDARALSTQTTSKAFKNGELDVDQFVKAREYEIRALEDGLTRSKTALNSRAFQQVPKALRRRTASHNAKKVPKRLRKRAEKEMVEDNTPTVRAKTRKKSGHMRLRMDLVKKLRAMNSQHQVEKGKARTGQNAATGDPVESVGTIKTRAPKIKEAAFSQPPVVKAKFRKRQIHKSWLPTHMYHAKRAHMTAPSQPLWRFSIPLSPTIKSYRPTYRASTVRGCVAWDTSYMSTIGLEGSEQSLVTMLRGMGVGEEHLTGKKGQKWRSGRRIFQTFTFERESPNHAMAPVTFIWCITMPQDDSETKYKRKMMLRVQPAVFFQVWEEILRLAKIAKPQVSVEDLRFEIGSIEIMGPGSTEALLGALRPAPLGSDSQHPETSRGREGIEIHADSATKPNQQGERSVSNTWKSLAGLTNPSSLPTNALLGFCIEDPRLHHPPRTIKVPTTQTEQDVLTDLLSSWPVDRTQRPLEIFDRRTRVAAGAALPSQKTINRRKALARPGQKPDALSKDPRIPVLLYTSSVSGTQSAKENRRGQSSWIVLLPWRCVQPVWYSIMYYPLSTGGQPHLGGLNQMRQLAFETGQPWFPADYPGTKAGWEWELREQDNRRDAWQRKPKSKRVSWEKVDLGGGRKGEIGVGWACDWDLLRNAPVSTNGELGIYDIAETMRSRPDDTAAEEMSTTMPAFRYVPADQAYRYLPSRASDPRCRPEAIPPMSLMTVRLTLVTRGVPQTCARIYNLPSDPSERKLWLALLPTNTARSNLQKKSAPPQRLPKNASAQSVQRFLAQELMAHMPKVGDTQYPACPTAKDLIGFVTTGNFNLSEGQGIGLGSVLMSKVMGLQGVEEKEGNLCIVRNAGEGVGRLARWDIV